MTEISELTASQLAADVIAGRLYAVEVAEAHLLRLAEVNS
jgi:hypothetical protein